MKPDTINIYTCITGITYFPLLGSFTLDLDFHFCLKLYVPYQKHVFTNVCEIISHNHQINMTFKYSDNRQMVKKTRNVNRFLTSRWSFFIRSQRIPWIGGNNILRFRLFHQIKKDGRKENIII